MKNTLKTPSLAVLIGLIMAVSGHAQSSFTNGLVAYYPFNGNANDASGNGLNATTNSGVTLASDRFGHTNSAYLFNGSSGFLNITDAVGKLNFDTRANNYSVTLWFLLSVTNPAGNGDQKFICDRFNNSPCSYDIYYRGSLNKFLVDIWDGGSGSLTLTSHTGTSPGIWHQISLVVSNRLCLFYLDGIENAGGGSVLGSNVGTTKNSDGIRQIGSDGITSTTRLHGVEDDIRIYNRALLPNEVQMLYQYESGGFQNLSATLALQLSPTNLVVGGSYQIQTSSNLVNWVNYGTPFIATSTNAPQFVSATNSHGYFRILAAP